ncbi:thyrotropin-releasing hormone-degrading ectoenzyme-like isoform X2 [Linepithema humile]|uniref:thyrotropin-releasing hormone-degrading ectoenzyme-like isoform X2 n=1 Tax=Linepithema humile TaxID=83485 RepID=UPI00351DEE7F
MIFQKPLTNGEIMLIITIALCTAVDPELETVIHLPHSIPLIPLHYNAKIKFSYETNDIIGECNITIYINRQTENISMHPVTFAIFKIYLYKDFDSEKIYIPNYSFIHKRNMLTIDFTNMPELPKFLTPGRYTLIMAYMRHINNDKIYISAFSYSKEIPDNILNATGVDVMTAQQLFPCWDKIAFNATYKISIKHHKNYTALSNMPIQATENDKFEYDMMWTHFEKSSSIFIEHVKVVITSFTRIHTSVANVTFWARKNIRGYLHLAECIAQQVLYFLKCKSSIDKSPKIDYVAFWDGQHNTTETWGLILQREADIIHDENSDPIGYKLKVSYLITYQIVSLWYSDVLLWSKTGFIRWLATYILYQITSEYNIMNLFIVETQRESFLFDTPSNTNKKNSFSYLVDHLKSSNIWHILHQLTADVFWTAICTYVNSTQYNQTNNLWNIIQIVLRTYPDNSSKLFIKKLISNWTTRKYYYPVLYVTRRYVDNEIIFEYRSNDFIDEDTEHLSAFVTYTTKSIMNFEDINENNSLSIAPQDIKPLWKQFDKDDWIIVNLQKIGYYRVNYNHKNWVKLAQYMNSTKYIDIHVLNRAQIIDDAFHFLIHKQLDYVTFWDISAFLSRETNYVEKMEKLLSGVLYKIGYNAKRNKKDFSERLRAEAIKWACIIANKECREVANMQMTKDLYSESGIFVTQSEWKAWMYCNGLVSANSTIWYDVWDKWATTPNNINFLEYLSCSEDPVVISDYLQLNLIDSFLLQHNNTRAHIILFIVARHASNDTVCDFILQNLKNNTFMFTSNTQADQIATLIVIITHQHVKQLNKVLEFTKVNLKEKRLVDAVDAKIKRRKSEYARKSSNYGVLGLFRLR